jgi:TPR repeat protein
MDTIKHLLACAILFCCFQSVSHAGLTFNEGMKAHETGDFAKAKLVFDQLAQLGHPPSQFQLAAMYYLGKGGDKDLVKAYGWFSLAEDSGRKDAKKIRDAIYKGLSLAEQKDAARFRDSLFGSYGWKALNATLIPVIMDSNDDYSHVEWIEGPKPNFPRMMANYEQEGWVDLEFTVSKEGYVRDLYVVETSHKRFVDFTTRAQRSHKYTPPLVDGRSSEIHGKKIRWLFKMLDNTGKFGSTDAELTYKRKLKELAASLLEKANTGDPYHQYVYGYLMSTHPDMERISHSEMALWYLKSAQGGVMPAQYELGLSLLYGRGSVADLEKAIKWLTLSAKSNYPRAQLLLGRVLLGLRDNPESAQQASFWLNKAAENNFPPGIMAAAWLQATSGDEKLRNPANALKLVLPAYEDYIDQVTALETMAAAYAANGDFKKAVKFQKEAIQEAKNLGWNPPPPMQHRLSAYKDSKAWYEPVEPQVK